MSVLKRGRIVKSTTSRNRYKILDHLGDGGFGKVYKAKVLSSGNHSYREIGLKVMEDVHSWQREAYFGQLLRNKKRVIQLKESFVLPPERGRRVFLYCLVFELALLGTVEDYLRKTERAWAERRVVREMRGLLKVLSSLHRGSATHGDLTPSNIFVCRNGLLKIGDFGIAFHFLSSKGSPVTAFNSGFVTAGHLESRHKYWLPVDDVYQLGVLFFILLSGNPDSRFLIEDVDSLQCGDLLKSIIKRCLGSRKKRFTNAQELLDSLAKITS
jgi:eukaryotic-like serine/threonine-protein kinase